MLLTRFLLNFGQTTGVRIARMVLTYVSVSCGVPRVSIFCRGSAWVFVGISVGIRWYSWVGISFRWLSLWLFLSMKEVSHPRVVSRLSAVAQAIKASSARDSQGQGAVGRIFGASVRVCGAFVLCADGPSGGAWRGGVGAVRVRGVWLGCEYAGLVRRRLVSWCAVTFVAHGCACFFVCWPVWSQWPHSCVCATLRERMASAVAWGVAARMTGDI